MRDGSRNGDIHAGEGHAGLTKLEGSKVPAWWKALLPGLLVPSAIVTIAGILLAAGFFFAVGPSAMGALGLQDLAITSFAYLVAPVVTLATIGAAYVFASELIEDGILWIGSRIRGVVKSKSRSERIALGSFSLILAGLLLLLMIAGPGGYYIRLLEFASLSFFFSSAIAIWRRRAESFKYRVRVVRAFVVPLFVSLTFLILGEANYEAAAQSSCVQLSGSDAGIVHPLIIGKDRILYRTLSGQIVLTDIKDVLPLMMQHACSEEDDQDLKNASRR